MLSDDGAVLRRGGADLADHRRKGTVRHASVAVRVLTNALEATDVAAVHSGYAKRRKALLEAGVDLYELRRSAAPGKKEERAGPFGSSGSSLHAKTFAVDGSRVFVGSFNFDPRSATLNTELGFVIDSPAVVQAIEAAPVWAMTTCSSRRRISITVSTPSCPNDESPQI